MQRYMNKLIKKKNPLTKLGKNCYPAVFDFTRKMGPDAEKGGVVAMHPSGVAARVPAPRPCGLHGLVGTAAPLLVPASAVPG